MYVRFLILLAIGALIAVAHAQVSGFDTGLLISSPGATASLSASPSTISSGSSSTLTWSSTGAPSCTSPGSLGDTAIPGFTGATSGSVSTGALTTTTTYSIQCGPATAVTSATTVTISGGPGTACSSPAVPHPAQVAGFTTLAYCIDFSDPANASPSTWYDCAGASVPQWYAYNGGVGTESSCNHLTIVNDPTAGTNVVKMTVDANAVNQSTFMTTGVPGCNAAGPFGQVTTCGELFPLSNMYVEFKVRIDSAAYTNVPTDGNNVLRYDLFAEPVGSGVELDFFEASSGAGFNQPAANFVPSGNNNGSTSQPPKDSNYHILGDLLTANTSQNKTGSCFYSDGVGQRCNQTTALTEQGYLIIWNTAGVPNGSTVAFSNYVWWVRVWSCAGWSSTGAQPPAHSNTTNTCQSSTVYGSPGSPP